MPQIEASKRLTCWGQNQSQVKELDAPGDVTIVALSPPRLGTHIKLLWTAFLNRSVTHPPCYLNYSAGEGLCSWPALCMPVHPPPPSSPPSPLQHTLLWRRDGSRPISWWWGWPLLGCPQEAPPRLTGCHRLPTAETTHRVTTAALETGTLPCPREPQTVSKC